MSDLSLTRDEAIKLYGTEAATGWGKAAADQNFKKQPATTTPSLDTGGGSPSLGAPAVIDTQSLYQQYYNSPEMKNTQSEIDALTKDLNAKKAAAAQAELSINDNPYYAESTRGGKINRQRTVANTDQQTLVDQINSAQARLATLKGDAETQTNLALKNYDIKSTAYQNNLSNLNSLLKSGALDGASPSDIANISASTGLSSSMITGMIAETKAGRINPQVISSTDDSGRVTVSIVDQRTGKLIGQNSLGKIDKSKSSGSTEDTKTNLSNIQNFLEDPKIKNSWGHVSPGDWAKAKQAYIDDHLGTGEDFIKTFGRYTDPNRGDFSTAYGFDVQTRYKLFGSN